MKRLLLIGASLALMLSGCQLSRAAEPAVLEAVDAALKQQLSAFITDIVGGNSVILADDVFMQQAELYISQRMPLDAKGNPLDGRHALPAYRFVLLKSARGCLIQHPASGNSALLTAARCKVLPVNTL
ncbi:hypothetical protein [Rheinheimera sp. UJ63]|uniref:hypothetical protein n=1 Tax=Rheinheimera sp. UJ63 TaxID=2910157 RepID=UPI001F3C9F72|nr:hypothetical protein [Rheinheimera sp. UJ63]MCF4008305.1 hypothetical protein [Rheinheimera sp. UJ63]